MPTRIKQTDNPAQRTSTLLVEGDMLAEDAAVVEKIAVTARSDTGNRVVIDLADLDFLDSDAASILKRLGDREGFAVEGGEVFLQTAIDMAERVETDLT